MAPPSSVRWPIPIALGLLAGAGCAVGPNFKAPPPPAASGYGASALTAPTASAAGAIGPSQQFAPAMDLPGQWWQLFQSADLNQLVVDSLKTNADLAAANAALRVAMENVKAQQGLYWPSISVAGNASRNRAAVQPSPYLANNALLYNLYQAQANVSWTPDIFGANRRAVEALKAQADAQRFQLESTQITLTTNVVAGAVQEASLRAQIAAAQDIVKTSVEALDILRKQQALGQIAGADAAAQEAAVAQFQQMLPPLEKQLAQQEDLLKALAGRLPSDTLGQTFDLAALRLPATLPVSLPSQLVGQRPDILIAEANLHAASAEIGVAIANLLPNLTLTADAGSIADVAKQVFGAGNGYWTIAGGVTQPIFAGGALRHKTKAARAAFDEAAAQYRSTVVTAFQNVADTLHALQSDADLLAAAERSERAAATSLEITRRQLQLGAVSYLSLLTAEQTYQQAKISLVQAQASRLSDTAALFQALGGGWWNARAPW